MFGSNVLDIAIGLAFLYLLLGLIVTTINELIESGLRKRAKDLEAGIREMFGGGDTVEEAKKKVAAIFPLPADAEAVKKFVEEFVQLAEREARWNTALPTTEPEATEFIEKAKKDADADARAKLVLSDAEKTTFVEAARKRYIADAEARAGQVAAGIKKLYEHPLLFSLFDGNYEAGGHKLPSYIPSRNFALALLDLVKPAGMKKSEQSGAAGAASAPTANPPVVVNVQSTAPPSPPAPTGTDPVGSIRTALENANLPEPVRKALRTLVDAAGNDMNRVRENIEGWFDGTMDRVSGWYKRRVQWISGVVAVVLVVSLNADTFAVATALARDPVLRAAVVTAAEGHVKAEEKKKADAEEKKTADAEAANKGKDANKAEGQSKTDKQKREEEEAKARLKAAAEKDILKDVSNQVNEVQGFGWPLGWDFGDNRTIPYTPFEWCKPPNWRAIGAWLIKVLGWLLTAAAVSLGAPFWFDALNRFITIRSTVKPTEKSKPKPSNE